MGEISLIQIEVPYTHNMRTLRVYLPSGYNEGNDSYPVLYMHDGQNVFTDDTATYGRSLRAKSILESLEKEKGFNKLIVVAIDNDSEIRYDEYSPWPCEKPKSNFDSTRIYGGKGDKYADFVAYDVRLLIERTYRVKRGSEHTYLFGSSMGGFISAYMAAKYPNIYGKAGIFSIASWFAEDQFLNYLDKTEINKKQKIYIQTGSNETSDKSNPFMSQWYIDNALNYYRKLLKRGIDADNLLLNITDGDEHCEKSWSDHMKEFFLFLNK